jgi:hypothetical protein
MNTNFNALSISYATFVALLLLLSACNSARESKEQVGTVTANNQTHKEPSYEEFKNMTPEERWRTASPTARNYLRQHPNRHPDMTRFVLAEPDMEEEPPRPALNTQNQAPAFTQPQADFMNYTPEQWWDSFTPERKQYMRAHPEEYPQFKAFFDKP